VAIILLVEAVLELLVPKILPMAALVFKTQSMAPTTIGAVAVAEAVTLVLLETVVKAVAVAVAPKFPAEA
jgi:hypothetical protein